MRWVALGLVFVAGAAAAQIEPLPTPEDARIGFAWALPGQQITLRLTPDSPVRVLFMPGEHVQSVSVGDPSAFNVSVRPAADSLIIQSLRQAATSFMNVRTDQRDWEFGLSSQQGAGSPSIVRLGEPRKAVPLPPPAPVYSPPGMPGALQPDPKPKTWKLAGDRELLPATIRDDGTHVYMTWSPAQAIPAVFAVTRPGKEEMVNGFMREGIFTIDRVYETLKFRIDRNMATARRVPLKIKVKQR